ncbi:unnamed protein product, partial [Staurois parvus]
ALPVPPFAAANYQVPTSDYPPAPGDYQESPTGRRATLFTTSPSPVGLGTLLWMVSSVLTMKHQHIAPQ